MASIVVIAGGMLGFLSGLLSLFMGLGVVAAIGLWCAIAISATGCAAALVILPRRTGFALRT